MPVPYSHICHGLQFTFCYAQAAILAKLELILRLFADTQRSYFGSEVIITQTIEQLYICPDCK